MPITVIHLQNLWNTNAISQMLTASFYIRWKSEPIARHLGGLECKHSVWSKMQTNKMDIDGSKAHA